MSLIIDETINNMSKPLFFFAVSVSLSIIYIIFHFLYARTIYEAIILEYSSFGVFGLSLILLCIGDMSLKKVKCQFIFFLINRYIEQKLYS